MSALKGRYPDSGVDVQRLASSFTASAGSAASVRLAATQRFVQSALQSNPALAGRFLRDMHLQHLPKLAQQLVEQAVAGHQGASRYQVGAQLASQLQRLSPGELQRVSERAQGKPLGAAIRDEVSARASEAKGKPAAHAMKPAAPPKGDLTSQIAKVTPRLERCHASALELQKTLERLWLLSPAPLSRGAELANGVGAHIALTTQAASAVAKVNLGAMRMQLGESAKAQAKDLAMRMTASREMLLGQRSSRQGQAERAYLAAANTLHRYLQANAAYRAVACQTPTDLAELSKLSTVMQQANELLSGQIATFNKLHAQCWEDELQYHEVAKGVAIEVIAAAASLLVPMPALGPAASVAADIAVGTAVGVGVENGWTALETGARRLDETRK